MSKIKESNAKKAYIREPLTQREKEIIQRLSDEAEMYLEEKYESYKNIK